MSDRRDELPIGDVDASGEALGTDAVARPEQPPMDDSAGPSEDEEQTETGDLCVQGGE